jgi:branched-chain amino acid transport system substrate-binding protein
VAALCALLGAAACAGGAPAGSVRVVLVDAFSGPSSVRGVTVQNSLQVEIDAIDARGGLLGHRIELVAADDEMKPGKAADLVREHLADERVGLLVGPGATGTYAAARPFLDRARVPNCLPVSVADRAVAGAPYSFRTSPGGAAATAALLDYVLGRTQVRSLGVLAASAAAAQAADQQLGALAPRSGIQYVGSVSLVDVPDARSAVQQLVSRGAQGLLLPDDAAAAGQAARALQDLGLQDRVPAFGLGALAALAYTDQAADAAAGTVVVAPIHSSLTGVPSWRWPPAYRAFVRGVAARYGYTTNGVEINGMPEAADCVALWARAVRRAGTFDGQQVARAWEGIRVTADEAVLGVPERFAPGQHDAIAAGDLFVYRWARSGGQYRLQQLVPAP